MEHETEEKKFIITFEQKELLLWNINNHALMDAKWIIRQLPEFTKDDKTDQELKLIYEFLGGYPEILKGVTNYIFLNTEDEKKDEQVQ